MKHGVRTELEHLLSYARAVGDGARKHPDLSAIVDGGRGYIGGALTTLHRLRLLADDEHQEWWKRLMDELPPTNWIAPPRRVAGFSEAIGIERVDFVSVPTRDVARARQFYGEVLGLPGSPSNSDEFEASNVTLSLWQPETQNVPFSPSTAGIALRVVDVNAARQQLVAKGVEFLGDTVDTGVCLMGFFFDLDRNVLILHRRYAPPGR